MRSDYDKQEEAVSMLYDIDNDGHDLTDWEIEFVESMMKKPKSALFTDAEIAKIKEIFEARV